MLRRSTARLSGAIPAMVTALLSASRIIAVALTSGSAPSNLNSPVPVVLAPRDNSRLFVLEQTDAIRTIKNGVLLERPLLDLSSGTAYCGERGLPGLAFHPNYESNGQLFVDYTAPCGGADRTRVARFQVAADSASAAASSRPITIKLDQPRRPGTPDCRLPLTPASSSILREIPVV